LCLCTLVVLASAFRRLALYESVFGYTRLRVSVHGTILWMAALFLLVLVAGIRMGGAWLPRAALLLTGVSLLVFTVIDPDHLIAQRNVERYGATGSIDLAYLSALSADAVPALATLPPRLARCALAPHAALSPHPAAYGASWSERVEGLRSPVAWNYGRRRAMAFIPSGQPAAPSTACRVAARQGLWP